MTCLYQNTGLWLGLKDLPARARIAIAEAKEVAQ
jgi:hypothetical protein